MAVRALVTIVFPALLTFCRVTAAADERDGVHQLLDRIETAWARHDLAAYDRDCLDRDLLAIVIPTTGPKKGPLVFTKKRFLQRVGQLWKRDVVKSYRLRDRHISIDGDIAWLRHTVVMELDGRPDQTARVTNLALRRSDGWKMCFSMPRFIRRVVLVTAVAPGAQAQRLGLQPGDIVTACGPEAVADSTALALRLIGEGDAHKPVPLTIRRGNKRIQLEAVPGELGIQLEDRLLPTAPAVLIEAHERHPIGDLVEARLQAFKAGDLDAMCAFLCPRGYLSVQPVASRFPIITTKDSVRARWAEELSQMQTTFEIPSFRLLEVRAIVHADVALVSCRFTGLQRGEKTEPVEISPRLSVYVRMDGRWWLTAALPSTTQIGLLRRDASTDGS